ncbi:hypothetical protein KL86DYS2_12919 [uncultured Dysgonomonas sp.]|uniref:Uncharacterized protein n=1 Tax=uncultured Dysgonomonas sp. TaxID=206096 RepID=A0A212IVH6_9BACT|nr:hypothetical protein KL86DYS1_10275 [uncultured Dysgonomonas sp.]SBV92085.1 hypothetical protein KL86DYS2_10299 [uncultured Dysgonomonas sp.]SBV96803.1 hypothetical protein KL86DYS1_11744 [uncultured Dysgonomonas sp.]SBW02251.1 hypothetical protein KL86DYS1_30238 [uncultured Dysgonomonas sp.]SBW05137.1 hypothetical protein KL86DYS1_31029 [uncultured Dysgonomonas sp.]
MGRPLKKGAALLNDVVVLRYTQFTGVGRGLEFKYTVNCSLLTVH